MYSTFLVSKSQCMTCNNEVLKQLGSMLGVFGAEMDRIEGSITINHTDEVTREELRMKLDSLGWTELPRPEDETSGLDYDEPSIWGCAL